MAYQLEGRFVNEFVKNEFPNALIYGRMRVGKPLTEFGVERLFPDKILIDNKTVYIIEGKVKPTTKAIGQLKAYVKLFPETPEFFFAKEYPIKLILVTTRDDPFVRPAAEAEGIKYVVFLPEWLDALLKERLAEKDG